MGLLQRLGFDISEEEVTAPAPATCKILKERGLRPHLLIHEGKPALGLTFEVKPGEKACTHACMHEPLGPNHGKHMHSKPDMFHDTCEFSEFMRLPAEGWGRGKTRPHLSLTSSLKASFRMLLRGKPEWCSF